MGSFNSHGLTVIRGRCISREANKAYILRPPSLARVLSKALAMCFHHHMLFWNFVKVKCLNSNGLSLGILSPGGSFLLHIPSCWLVLERLRASGDLGLSCSNTPGWGLVGYVYVVLIHFHELLSDSKLATREWLIPMASRNTPATLC